MFCGVCLKPLLFCGGRGEGREKQGQKNEKAIIIIAVFPKRSTKKRPPGSSVKVFFGDNILSKNRAVEKTAWFHENDDFICDSVTGYYPRT
jgi:hypothetical protein